MCGIAGRILLDPCQVKSSPDQFSSLLAAALRHRGPDDFGHWEQPLGDGPSALLLHQRLAIQDLSAAGHQPMHSACGRYVLVFNGEIYNQRELRRELEAQGHSFRSSSDTEVLLAFGREGVQPCYACAACMPFAQGSRATHRPARPRSLRHEASLFLAGQRESFKPELRALLALIGDAVSTPVL